MEFLEKISVIMPTYNTSVLILKEAVESILKQTFHDFEFIIIDDGSTNEACNYLESLNDRRIRLIRNKSNIGITKSLNIGLKEAKGKYIARMDADDIALPTRFEKQYAFMEQHPDVIVLGTNYEKFGCKSYKSSAKSVDQELYRVRLLFENPGPKHPTAFFNHEVFLTYQIQYDESLHYAQDYALWTNVIHYGKIEVLQDNLLLYREHIDQISQDHREEQLTCANLIRNKQIRVLVENVTENELTLHNKYCVSQYENLYLTKEILTWYKKIIKANKIKKLYNQRKLKYWIKIILMRIIINTKELSKTQKMIQLIRHIPPSILINETNGIRWILSRIARVFLFERR